MIDYLIIDCLWERDFTFSHFNLNKVLSLFTSIGYTVEFNVLNASKFGV